MSMKSFFVSGHSKRLLIGSDDNGNDNDNDILPVWRKDYFVSRVLFTHLVWCITY